MNASKILIDGGILAIVMSAFFIGVGLYNMRLYLNKGDIPADILAAVRASHTSSNLSSRFGDRKRLGGTASRRTLMPDRHSCESNLLIHLRSGASAAASARRIIFPTSGTAFATTIPTFGCSSRKTRNTSSAKA